jgi:hypothetical protein
MRFDDHRLTANLLVVHETAFHVRQTDLPCMDDQQTRHRDGVGHDPSFPYAGKGLHYLLRSVSP